MLYFANSLKGEGKGKRKKIYLKFELLKNSWPFIWFRFKDALTKETVL